MKQEYKAVGSFGTVGLEVVLCMLVGLFIGRWIDGKLGTEPIFSVVWFFFGVAAGGKAVYRTWKEMQAVAAREEREQGNPAPLFEKTKSGAHEDDRWKGDEPPTDHGEGANGAPAKERDER